MAGPSHLTAQRGLLGLLIVLAFALGAVPLALRSAAAPGLPAMHTVTGVPVDPAVAALWEATDRAVADKTATRAWLWGPAALAATIEYSADSPTGRRETAYFD